MAKIIGNTTATPNPRPDWAQTDETKADYIKNKPTILTEEDVVELIAENGGGGGGSVDQIQSDWEQTDKTKVDYIKNKPELDGVLKYTEQSLTEDQKAQVRTNIGAGTSSFSGSYNDLAYQPTIPVALSDLATTPDCMTVTEDQINSWDSKSDFDGDYNSLTNKPTIPSIEGLATEDYVNTKVASMVDSAPETLDTLNELAAALGDDPNFATTIATQIGNKADMSYVDEKIGDIDSALDSIIAMQGELIGGETV